MSIADLTSTFNAIALEKGTRCTGALLLYCDAKGVHGAGKRDHQQLVFNCVRSSDNTTHQFTSDPVPPGGSIIAAAADVARKAIGE